MPARRAPPFLPEEMGGKKGRGASPTLDPPIRGFMAAESCTDKARTGRASTPGTFFGFVTGAAAPWGPASITRQALTAAALYRPGPPGRRRCLPPKGRGAPRNRRVTAHSVGADIIRPFVPETACPVGRDDPARRSFTGVPYGFSGSTGISPCSFSYCFR